MYSAKDYTSNFQGDVFGGVTAAVVALPLALAFGISSGAGAVAGLYGAICVGLFAAIFGGTPSQISGPTGPMTVVMAAMSTTYMAQYPDYGLVLAFSTVFLGGCFQVLLGLLKVGRYIIMVPYPVISGFMSGIGVIIILLELAPLLGFPSSSNVMAAVAALPEQIIHSHSGDLLAGSLCLAVVFLWRGSVNRIIPSPLLALIAVSFIMNVFFNNAEFESIGEIPSALPSLNFPVFKVELLETMLVNALMLAVLGSIDSLLTSLVADNISESRHDSEKELVGQGIGNMMAGLLGGLPGAGATMRTVVNIRAGGKGPLSGVVHALILLAIVAGMGFLFESIPLAVLAGILIKVGVDIIDWPFIKRLHRIPRFAVLLMCIVLLLTVFVDLITAVFVGVFIKNLVTVSQLADFQLGSVVFSDGEKNADSLSLEEQKFLLEKQGKAFLLRISGPVSYAVGRGLSERFHENISEAQMLLIDISGAVMIGVSSVLAIESLVKKAQEGGAEVKLIGANFEQSKMLQQMGLLDLVGQKNCLSDIASVFSKE